MLAKRYDWINDEDVKYELVAETVVILYNDKDLCKMRFEEFAKHKDNNLSNYCASDQQQLAVYAQSVRAAIEGAYKIRFGQALNVLPSQEGHFYNLVDLILAVYCKYKNEKRLDEVMCKK